MEEYINGKEKIEGCFRGKVKQSTEMIQIFEKDEDSNELIKKWLNKGKVKKLAELWVKGLQLDWILLYGEIKPRRISLPTYPFKRERYWISEVDNKHNAVKPTNTVTEDQIYQERSQSLPSGISVKTKNVINPNSHNPLNKPTGISLSILEDNKKILRREFNEKSSSTSLSLMNSTLTQNKIDYSRINNISEPEPS